MDMMIPPEELETPAVEEIDARYKECAVCKHFPAYHDQPDKKCRAWTDTTDDSKCDCKGWKEPVAKKPQGDANGL